MAMRPFSFCAPVNEEYHEVFWNGVPILYNALVAVTERREISEGEMRTMGPVYASSVSDIYEVGEAGWKCSCHTIVFVQGLHIAAPLARNVGELKTEIGKARDCWPWQVAQAWSLEGLVYCDLDSRVSTAAPDAEKGKDVGVSTATRTTAEAGTASSRW